MHSVKELNLTAPYTIEDVVVACANFLGLGVTLENIASDDYAFQLTYEEGANFSGIETIREVLNRAAEATQTIYYIDFNNNIRFKRLDVNGDALATITDNDYFSLNHSDNRRLVGVCSITELGNNVQADLGVSGTIQYIRDNPFWDLRQDIATILDNALANVGGLTINQFDCNWRGNLPLEVGDKIDLKKVCNENCVQSAYVLDDVITYDGGYSQQTQWKYENSDVETESTPTSIGDAINNTFAKVDRINNQIILQAGLIEENSSKISSIEINTDSINSTVSTMQQTIKEGLDGLTQEVETLSKQVSTSITQDGMEIAIKSALENGVGKVETNTGYMFDDNGLTISKSNSEMTTQITEDGMTVSKSGEIVLTADNEGVKAQNLHATTYLIIGTNSRFEDYGNRTGCFWIGG